MKMKCPVCGGAMERQYGAFGDLYQGNSFRYMCARCGYGGASEDDIFAEAVRKIQKEMEGDADGGK